MSISAVVGAMVGLFLSAIALACLWGVVDGIRHRRWKFAAGALLIACFFGLYSLPYWEAASTGKFPSGGSDEPPPPRSR